MMQLLFASIVAIGAISVEIAPDQPLNFVYTDDPLIIEVASDTRAEAQVAVIVRGPANTPAIEHDAGRLSLHANAVRWIAVEGLPETRGFYEAQVRVSTAEGSTEHRVAFCRIDRALPRKSLPFVADNLPPDPRVLVALQHAGIARIRLRIEDPKAPTLFRAARDMNFEIILRFDPAAGGLEAWSGHDLAAASAWEIDAHDDPATYAAALRAVRAAQGTAAARPVVSGAAPLRALLSAAGDADFNAAVLEGAAADTATCVAARIAAAEAGYEDWKLAIYPAPVTGASPGVIVARLLEALAGGATLAGVDASALFDDGLTAAFAGLIGFSPRLVGTEHCGTLALAEGVRAPVYRNGAAWLLALWSTGGEKEVTLPIDGAQNLSLTDAMSNPMPLSSTKAPKLKLNHDLLYLTGEGGEILAVAAANKAGNLARQMLDTPAYAQYLPPELLDALRQIARTAGVGIDRTQFFLLIRSFPELEARWHAGVLPRNIAVPALADLARLARALCAAEERSGANFIEPLADTLDRCEEYQARYLTGSSSAPAHHRGDWLLNEVRRLSEEAEAVARSDRRIEAAALATLAEWRARALEVAASAGQRSETAAPVQIARAVEDPLPPPTVPATGPPVPSPTPATDAATAPASSEPAADHGGIAADPPDQPKPQPDSSVKAAAAAPPDTPVLPAGSLVVAHKVASGDSIAAIARLYGVAEDDLRAWNGLKKDAALKQGATVNVYVPAAKGRAPGQPPNTIAITHTVAQGESPKSIAARYGVEQRAFEQWNGLRRDATLARGRQYTVYVPAKAPEATAPPKPAAPAASGAVGGSDAPEGTRRITHTVARGDNPYTIAKRYKVSLEDFLRWNNLKKNATLHIGQQYVVYVKQ
jgi:LysM repeat protein